MKYGIPTAEAEAQPRVTSIAKGTPVAIILAPKSQIPVYISLSGNDLQGASPDGSLRIAEGYFGDEGYEGCYRQHMAPGILSKDDKGKGFGAAMYMGGVLAVADETECTFSRYSDRSGDADRLWASLVRQHIAQEQEEEEEYSVTITASGKDSIDIDEDGAFSVDESYLMGQVALELDVSESDIQEMDWDVDADVQVDATIDVTGTYGEGTVNTLPLTNVLGSGLVLYIYPDGPAGAYVDDRDPVPSLIVASSWWGETDAPELADIIWQNSELSGDPPKYVEEVLRNLEVPDDKLYDVVKHLVEEHEATFPWLENEDTLSTSLSDVFPAELRASNPVRAEGVGEEEAAAWRSVYGKHSEWNPSMTMKKARRIRRKRKKELLR